jgi:V/A-type H+-transporting ATPase subunit E
VELLKAIEAEAEKRCQEARDRGEEEVRRIQEEAEDQISAKRESARDESNRKLRQQETVLVSQAETKVQREQAVAKSELVEQAMSQAREKLAQVAKSEHYPAVFRKLAEEAVSEIKEGFTAVVRPEDENLARSTLESLGARGFQIATDGRFLGGLIVESEDGRSRVVNTLDARFERVHEEAVLRIAPLLFG